jgi:hypothetical protein
MIRITSHHFTSLHVTSLHFTLLRRTGRDKTGLKQATNAVSRSREHRTTDSTSMNSLCRVFTAAIRTLFLESLVRRSTRWLSGFHSTSRPTARAKAEMVRVRVRVRVRKAAMS